MQFFTSYYAHLYKIPSDYITISISSDIPDYIRVQVDGWDRRLAPNLDLFKEYKSSPEGPIREIRYVERFKAEVLTKNDINDIIKDWSDKYGLNQKYVLLCYEKPEDFCHRHIVAEAIEEKYGIEVKELNIDMDNYSREDYKYKVKSTFVEEEW